MSTLLLLAAGLAGAIVGALVVLWVLRARRQRPAATAAPSTLVPSGVAAVLATLRSSTLIVDPDDVVVQASPTASELGLVHRNRLVEPDLAALVRQVRGDRLVRESELVFNGGRGVAPRHVLARVAPLDARLLLVLVKDRTRERRVEAVRRDFTVNVSHELKTPVGALTLLAEAVGEAAGDPAAVERFAGRMRVEADRLSRLVQQVIELSRLQDDQLLDEPRRVAVDALVTAALDRNRAVAEARRVDLVGQDDTSLSVSGNAGQLEVALSNLVDNAVAFSDDHGRVVVTAKAVDDTVHVVVSDEGAGIAADEVERIFERFYRVDPARASSTGGTGLGLSIVKHVAASHGGEVRVWSVPGTGSSFTLVLPAWDDFSGAAPPDPVTVGEAGS